MMINVLELLSENPDLPTTTGYPVVMLRSLYRGYIEKGISVVGQKCHHSNTTVAYCVISE